MNKNNEIFKEISKLDGQELVIELNENFDTSLNKFREITSKTRTVKGLDYPAVYLSPKDFGGLRIKYGSGKEFCVIVNLEFYYIYGFLLEHGKVYAFKREAEVSLEEFGFETIEIPFGDGYYDIKRQLSKEEFENLLSTSVELNQITSSLDQIADTSIRFEDKAKSLLIFLWSLIEGIRFAEISSVVSNVLQKKHSSTKYETFFDLAEHWADLSVKAAKEHKKDPRIAVYDLHRIHH